MAGLLPIANITTKGLMRPEDVKMQHVVSSLLAENTTYKIMSIPLYYRNIVALEFGDFANPPTTMMLLNVNNRGYSTANNQISGKRISGAGKLYFRLTSDNTMELFVEIGKGSYPSVLIRSLFTTHYNYPNSTEKVDIDVSTLTEIVIS